MIKVVWSLFLTGLFLGYGPCLVSCGPLLVSYIAATKQNGLSGLKTYAIFSATRMAVYCAFGIFAGIFGEWVMRAFFESTHLNYLFFLFGIFLFLIGIVFISERSMVGKKCSGLIHRYMEPSDARTTVLFGLIVSFSPCLPLMAILGYIALISDAWHKGLLYMGAFGLGTVISPLLVFSFAAGWLGSFLKRHDKAVHIVRVLCGLVIALLGLNLIFLSYEQIFHR